jgi:Domain of unknown function (DUF4169)
MADITNLNHVKKQKARADREARAAENRIKFGLSKATKTLSRSEKTRAEKNLDGHKRDK